MEVVSSSPVLNCTFLEFWTEFLSKFHTSALSREYVFEAFRGESQTRPKFRIPAADSGGDVFFDSRELLCRYCALPTPTQAGFLKAIRKALADNKVDQIEIEFAWSSSTSRKMRVRSSGGLDFILV
jgi:hypothetical protein